MQIALTRQDSGVAEALVLPDLQAIDATSSPIRFRACFTAPLSLTALRETYVPYEAAQPRIAPGWFGCFDAPRLGGDLQAGRAQAFLGVADVAYGIDLVVAVDAQGRGYAWHQINPCGEKVFEGDPAPRGLPVPPAAQ